MITNRSLFVDTSGWVCVADKDQAQHDAVSAEYKGAIARRRGLVTTNYVLNEVAALLPSRTRITQVQMIAFIETIMASPHIEIVHIDPALHAAAWALLKARQDKEWSLVDASSFVVMQAYGMRDALTTDHHFEQAQFTRLPTQP